MRVAFVAELLTGCRALKVLATNCGILAVVAPGWRRPGRWPVLPTPTTAERAAQVVYREYGEPVPAATIARVVGAPMSASGKRPIAIALGNCRTLRARRRQDRLAAGEMLLALRGARPRVHVSSCAP